MNSRRIAFTLLAAVGGAMAWAARGALDAHRVLVSWDTQGHVLRAWHALHDLSFRHGWSAWFPYWHGGFPMSEVYPPLNTWVLSGMVALGADTVGPQVLLVALWVGIVPCSYFFLRSFGLDRVPAAMGAALTMALDARWTFGSIAIVKLGLMPQAWGFLLAIIAVAHAKRFLDGAPTTAGAARVALFGGLTLLAHPLSSLWLALAWTILLVTHAGSAPKRVWLFGAAAVGAAVIGSFYWLPLLAVRHSMLVTEPFQTPSLGHVWRSVAALRAAGGPALALLAAVGLAELARTGNKRSLMFLTGLLVGGFVLTTGVLRTVLPFTDRFGHTQWIRFEGFYGWTALMAAAFAVDAAVRSALLSPRARLRLGLVGGTVLLLTGMALWRQTDHVRSVLPNMRAPFERLAGELQKRHHPGDFLLSENSVVTEQVLGSPHFLNQRLARENPLFWDQGGSLPEGTAAAGDFFLLSRALDRGILQSRDLLLSGGVRFVITTRPRSQKALDGVPWLTPVWSDAAFPGLALYETNDRGRVFGLPPSLSTPVHAVNFTSDAGYHLCFSAAQPLAYPVSTALAFHPWLRATADGRPMDTGEGPFKRLQLNAGPSAAADIRIFYSQPRWLLPIRALALSVLLAAFGFSVFRRRNTPL